MSNLAKQRIQKELIRDILKTHAYLPKTGSFSNTPLKRGADKIFEGLSIKYNIVQEPRIFTECFSQDTFDSFESKRERLFVLKEIRRESHLLPVVGLRYKIGKENLSISLRVGLFQNYCKNDVVAFGYRYESPSKNDYEDSGKTEDEGEKSPSKEVTTEVAVSRSASKTPAPKASIEGSHDFFHAQPIRAFKKDDKRYRLPHCPDWFTQKQPSFPLDAKCPVTLTLAFLIGIYGMTCWSEIKANRVLHNKVKEMVKELHIYEFNNLN